MSKQQEAAISKIVSYNPATWFLVCESEVVKIPEEDRAEFGKILLDAMDVYKSKVQNVIPILKRGPNLNPEVNIRAWAMMHARFLARLFIKHPTLCKRLCVKLSNEIYNPGWRFHVKKFKVIEKHKGEIEEQVEAACRESQLFFSTHSGYDFFITNHSDSTHGYQSRPQILPRFEGQSRKTAAESLLALFQSDEAQYSHESTSSTHATPPQISPLQVNSGHDQTTTSSSQSSTGRNQPNHVRFALALEKSAAAELEAISKINGNSFYRTTQGKAHQLHPERNLQAQITFQNGVSDNELDRPTSTKESNKTNRVATSSNSRGASATKSAAIPESDIRDKQFISRNSDGEVRTSDNRQEVSSRQGLSLSSIQGDTLSEAATTDLSPGIEYDFRNNNSFPEEPVDGDNDERFSLREMIDAMEFVAEHPWICENLLVHHVWDEYKLFHEYNTEALKVAEEEIQESNRATAKKAKSSTKKGTEVGSPNTSACRTRSTSQTSRSPSVPHSRPVPSIFQVNPTDEANANKMTAAEEEQAITAAAKAGFGNRNFQLQVATVYRALGVVPTATGPVPSNHAPFHRVQSSESFAPIENVAPRQGKSSVRSAYDDNRPKRRSRSSKAAHLVVDDNTIIVGTSSLVPVHVHSVPNYIAPPRRSRLSEDSVPAYAAPKRRSQSTIGQASVAHNTDANRSPESDIAKQSLDPTVTRAQMREKLQVSAVFQSLGRQDETLSESFGNDGARADMKEGVEEARSKIHNLTTGMIRHGRNDDMYKIHHDRRILTFGLEANVLETFAQDPSLSMHGEVGALSDFGFNSFVNQDMGLGTGLAPRHRLATVAGQYQEDFAVNQTRTEQEMEFPGVGFCGPGTLNFNHRISGIYGLSQPIAALDNPQEDFWMHQSNFADFGPFGMGLDMEDNMNLGANILPAPNLNDIHGPENNRSDFRGNHNFDFSAEDEPFSGRGEPSRHLGASNPDTGSSSFGGMKQSFGSVNHNLGGMNQAPVGFEGMNDFVFQSTPLTKFDSQFDFGNMSQPFNQPGRMDLVDILEPPRRDRAGARSQPGKAIVPETPNRTLAGTRSQRRYDFSARGGNYFRFQDIELVDGDGGDDCVGGEDEEQDEEDDDEESPSKRARHRKGSSKGSDRNTARVSAKGSAKDTPRKSRKTPVKKGSKVAFNPRPAIAPSTLDRSPAQRYYQSIINISPGAFGPQINLEIPDRQG